MNEQKPTKDRAENQTRAEGMVDKKPPSLNAENIKENTLKALGNSYRLIAKNRFPFIALISMAVILIAFGIIRTDINPKRDENLYSEGVSKIKYLSVDEEHLQTLKDSLQNDGVTVESEFVPNRTNPFAE